MQRDYIQAIKAAEYGKSRQDKLQIAIQHIFTRVRPTEQEKRMENIIKWCKDGKYKEEHFGRFLRELDRLAKKLQEKC